VLFGPLYLRRSNKHFAVFAVVNGDCVCVVKEVDVAVFAVLDYHLLA
jgi:hypothetical protein